MSPYVDFVTADGEEVSLYHEKEKESPEVTIEKNTEITSARSVSTSDELSPGKEKSHEVVIGSRTLSADAIVVREGNLISPYSLSDDEMQELLSGYSVTQVKGLLDAIIVKDSIDKDKRHEIVFRVIQNQPHKTSEFKDYDKHNYFVGITRKVRAEPYLFVTLLPPVSSFALAGVGGLEALAGVNAFGLWFLLAGAALALFFPVKAAVSSLTAMGAHESVYKERADNPLSWSKQEEETRRNRILQTKQRQLAELAAEISGENSTVSLAQVTQDYMDAVARIASYETDLSKALKYPAFNDISVPAVQGMVKQLRVCKSKFAVLSASNANNFAEDVAELWVRIQTAEEEAKRIGLKSLDADELKLLEKIKGLAAHSADLTYSDDVRAGFYQQLKISVNKLNENRTVVPTKIVTEIEQKAALLLEQTKEEGAHV